MTIEQQIRGLEAEIKCLEYDNLVRAGTIKHDEDRIATLKQKIAALKKQRFYIGDKFHTMDVIYVLAAVNDKTPRLISVSSGQDKANGVQFDIPIRVDTETGRDYVTQLPTLFPEDFNLPATCKGRVVNA